MKHYFIFLLILVGVAVSSLTIPPIMGENEKESLKLDNLASELWYDHEFIVDGTILDIRGFDKPERTYDLQINSFFKPKEGTNSKLITVNGAPNFYNIKGDRGIFFIKKVDSQWEFGKYAAKITKECLPEMMYHNPPLIVPPLTRGMHPMDFDMMVDCYPHYYKKYLPQYMKAYGATEFPSPRIQLGDRVSPQEIVCNGTLDLVQKHDGSPACVKPETKIKLIEREWAKIPKSNQETKAMNFQGKPLDYWKSLDFETLREYNRQTTDDKFYYDLGEMIAKEFFEDKLAKEEMLYTNDFLKLYTGITLTPDPPIIGYNTVINATDGFTYVLHTSVQGNKIREYFSMERLIFEPHILRAIADGTQPSFVNKFGASPTIYIVTENGEDLMYPNHAIIDFEQVDSVMFVNDSNEPVRVQEALENKISEIPEDSWRTGTIMPGDSISVQFNSTGYYEFSVKKMEGSREGYLDHHEFGEIAVFSEGMDNHTLKDALLMGRVFVNDVPRVEMPWETISAGNSQGLKIGIIESVKQTIPNAEEYYLAKAKSLIPFEVNVIIE